MRESKSDSPSSDSADLVASLLARIDQLVAQVAARDERIAELLAQVKALNARIAELEAKLGGPPKTPDNSSLPPSRGQKANAEPPKSKRQRKGRPGVTRQLAENPDQTRRFYAERCTCGAVLGEAGQELAKEYDHIDIPPIRPIITRIELFRAVCPCCKGCVKACSASRSRDADKSNKLQPSFSCFNEAEARAPRMHESGHMRPSAISSLQ